MSGNSEAVLQRVSSPLPPSHADTRLTRPHPPGCRSVRLLSCPVVVCVASIGQRFVLWRASGVVGWLAGQWVGGWSQCSLCARSVEWPEASPHGLRINRQPISDVPISKVVIARVLPGAAVLSVLCAVCCVPCAVCRVCDVTTSLNASYAWPKRLYRSHPNCW